MKTKSIIQIVTLSLVLLLVSMSLSGCYKDLSNQLDRKIEMPVLSEESLDSNLKFFVESREHFQFDPEVKYAGNDPLLYEWFISESTTDNQEVVFEKVNEGAKADFIVSKPLGTYYLRFQITNPNEENLTNIYEWQITVQGSFITGLLVADTKDNGVTSDFTYIKSYGLSENYPEDKEDVVLKDILITGPDKKAIPGEVSSITYNFYKQQYIYFGRGGGLAQVWATTKDGKAFRYDVENFRENGSLSDGQIIIHQGSNFKVQRFFKSGTLFYMQSSEGLHGFKPGETNLFSVVDGFFKDVAFKDGVVATTFRSNEVSDLVWIDEKTGAVTSRYKLDWRSPFVFTNYQSGAFDPSNLKNKRVIAASIPDDKKNTEVYFVLKDNISGEYGLYQLSQGTVSSSVFTQGSAMNLFAIPASFTEKMDKAKSIIFSKEEKGFYLVTDKEIYFLTYGVGAEVSISQPLFTLPNNETFTMGKLYIQGQYMVDPTSVPSSWMSIARTPYHLRALVVASQLSDTSGTVRVLPLKDSGTAVETENIDEYTGLGKVLDVTGIGRPVK